MSQKWGAASWRERPAKYIPVDYPNPAEVTRVGAELRRMPPLVFPDGAIPNTPPRPH